MIRAVIAFSLAASAAASCDNGCSGHGVCDCGFCLCYDNWGMNYDLDTGDCSDRICPFEFAWVDNPDKSGRFHKYAECANRGICNRQTGECECFDGYEGKGCQRTSCPNDCSGHGTCEFIDSLGFANTPFSNTFRGASPGFFVQDPKTFPVATWDTQKTRGCVCDPEYGDIDCSKRLCPYGNDVMDRRVRMQDALKYQVQNIYFYDEQDITNNNGRTFALTFKSRLNETFTTEPITFRSEAADLDLLVEDITDKLKNLPNRVIDDVEVHAYLGVTANQVHVNVTFIGDYVQGRQNLLLVEDFKCGDGCTPKVDGLNLRINRQNVTEVLAADYNSYECGRRGKCDYDTGLCQCFEGFTGPACNSCTAMI